MPEFNPPYEENEIENFEFDEPDVIKKTWYSKLDTKQRFLAIGGTLLAVLAISTGALAYYIQTRDYETSTTSLADEEIVEQILDNQPSPEASISPTPSPDADSTPDPTASAQPSSSPVASPTSSPNSSPKSNLYFKFTPKLFATQIVKGNRRLAPEGHVTSDGGYSFYYQYDTAAHQSDASSFNLGTKLYLGVTVENSEQVSTPKTSVLSKLILPDNKEVSQSYDFENLNKGDNFDFSFRPNELNNRQGQFKFELSIDPGNFVSETNESDNSYTRTITVNPDKTPPYLEIYPWAIEQSGQEVCFNYKSSAFTRDDQDAIDGTGASKRTQLRWKTSLDDGFTDWVDYDQKEVVYPNKRCVSATAGTDYTLFVEARDQNGNTTALSKTFTAN